MLDSCLQTEVSISRSNRVRKPFVRNSGMLHMYDVLSWLCTNRLDTKSSVKSLSRFLLNVVLIDRP